MSQRFRGLAIAALSVGLALTATPAIAKPPVKAGAVTNLVLSATKTGGTYNVGSTWSAGTNATKYVVRLSKSGVTLDSATVTGLSWTGHTSEAAGSLVTVTVTSYNGTRKGGVRSANLTLPDLTAPTASYVVTHDPAPSGPNVTVTVTGLSDNVTPVASIVQTIDWGDGTPVEPWNTSNAAIVHAYPDAEARYVAGVTLADQAGNQRSYPLVVVVQDVMAPTGSFALSTPTAWAKWTPVGIDQAAINDNLSPDDQIARVINWGDGAQSVWAQGTNPTHVYATAGSYSPTVVLTDEAGNSSSGFGTSTVVVAADTMKPVIKLTPPKFRKARVASWRVLTGRASDAQTGMRNVALKAIEKRGASWFSYQPATRTWVKSGATKARAWRKATVVKVNVASAGTWAVRLPRLTKGTLIYRARAVDNRSNASAWVAKRAVLTRR